MTRRGSLVYYLTAWVVGCISAVVMMRLLPSRMPSASVGYGSDAGVASFLGLAMASLMAGALPSLLFAWILRRLLAKLPAARALLWILTGAILSPVLVFILGSGDRYFDAAPAGPGSHMAGVIRFALMLLFSAPGMVLATGLASAIPAGAITAYVLFLIYRGFEAQQPAQPEPAPQEIASQEIAPQVIDPRQKLSGR
ncbi:MAG: hypothetical protein GZ088_03075 [Acidipila sp.]|nr:hypothetical protein [Acidipila sp.]